MERSTTERAAFGCRKDSHPGGPGDELPTSSDERRMVGMITGFWVSQLVRAVADLNVAEHLADGSLSAAELAEREGSEPDSTSRLLRAAAALGLLTRDEHHRFHGTPLLATLRRDVPGSLRGLALGRTVAAGHRARGPTARSSSCLLQADPTPPGWRARDRPEVLPRAAQEAARNGLGQRLDTLAGDFFEGVPEADLYLLKFILHDWDDESCVKILRNCRSAMRPQARVAVVEMVVDAAGEPGLAELQDLNMLVVTSGRERSLDEYDALLTAARLRRHRLIATDSPLSVIEAVAA